MAVGDEISGAIKTEVAGLRTFIEEREGKVKESREKLEAAVKAVQDDVRRLRRAEILKSASGRPRVLSGKWAGFDRLDATLMGSLLRAARATGDTAALDQWKLNLAAAMSSTQAGEGDELVPTDEASQLWMDVNLETLVASQFSRIQMPTTPFDVPLQLGDVNWYPGEENAATRSTALATAKQTLTAYELVAEVPWSLTLDEDSVIAMLPELRRTLVRNSAEVLDDLVVNADSATTLNVNYDGGTLAKTTVGKAHYLIGFNGLVKQALVTGPAANRNNVAGAATVTTFLDLLKDLGKYGIRPREAVFVTDIATFLSLLSITEVLTVDKYGPQATVLRGELASIFGHPIVVCEQMLLAASDGKVTFDTAGTVGRIAAVNSSQWRIGMRRDLSIEVERDIQKRQNIMVVSFRMAFNERSGTPSTATHTALAYNITV